MIAIFLMKLFLNLKKINSSNVFSNPGHKILYLIISFPNSLLLLFLENAW